MKVMLLAPETLGSARVKIAQLSIESRYPIDGQERKGINEKSTTAM